MDKVRGKNLITLLIPRGGSLWATHILYDELLLATSLQNAELKYTIQNLLNNLPDTSYCSALIHTGFDENNLHHFNIHFGNEISSFALVDNHFHLIELL